MGGLTRSYVIQRVLMWALTIWIGVTLTFTIPRLAKSDPTTAMVLRMMCDGYLLQSASLGSPGVDNVRWLKPVRPGDRLRAQMTVTEARPSSSKPDRGTIKSKWEVFNQNDELVMTMEGYGMFKRRNVEERRE